MTVFNRTALAVLVLLIASASLVTAEIGKPISDTKNGYRIAVPNRWEPQPIPPPTDYEGLGIDPEQRALFENKEIEPLQINKDSQGGTFRLFKLKAETLEDAEKMALSFAATKNLGDPVEKKVFRPSCQKTKMTQLRFEYAQKTWGGTINYILQYFAANNANGSFLLTYGYRDVQKQYFDPVLESAKSFGYIEKKEAKDPAKADDYRYQIPAGWSIVETANYIIQNNERFEDKVKEFGAKIEQLHAAHIKVLKPDTELEKYRPQKQFRKFLIKYFRDSKTFYDYAGDQGLMGAAAWYNPEGGEIAFFNLGWKRKTAGVLAHEGTHQYLQEFVGGPRVGFHICFNEGLSEYFNGAVMGDAYKIEIGNPLTECENVIRGAIRNGKNLQVPELLKMTQAQFYAIGRYAYDHGWSIVYFLLHCKNKRYNEVIPRYFYEIQSRAFPVLQALADGGKDINKKKEEGEADTAEKPNEPKGPADYSMLQNAQFEALDKAFEGIDMQQLQKDWEDYWR